jgi:hypothetical protein
MAELKETWNRHAADLVAGNMAGLMGDFTPSGMAKAMALAANPITAQSFEIKDLGGNEVEITYIGANSQRKVWSKWEETSPGKWQVSDLAERAGA